MAYSIWNEKPGNQDKSEAMSAKKQIGFAMSVSLLNPHAIMDTIGVIGTSATTYAGHNRIAFTLTCIAVSWLWFLSLAYIGKIIGAIDKQGNIIVILNNVSAIIILIVACIVIKNIIDMF